MNAITIIGSGMAGITLAREFRKLDPSTPLRIITADDGGFYAKPMLSNAFALHKSPAQLVTQTATQLAEQYQLEIMTHTRVLHIDSARRTIQSNVGEVTYSKCVLATGAQAIRLNIAGDGAQEIMSINQLDDYRQFRLRIEQLTKVKTQIRIAIIGAGLIGCEFADDLARAGFHIDLIDPNQAPLAALLAPRAATELHDALQRAGVTFHAQCTTTSVTRTSAGQASRLQITLSNGKLINTDLVLSAVGSRPDLHLAHTVSPTPLKTDRGICINVYGETSTSDIYALGDNAQYARTDGGHQLLPYIAPIMAAAKAIAHNLLGATRPIQLTPTPIIVKTPSYPVATLAPPPGITGSWEYTSTPQGHNTQLSARFFDLQNHVQGFTLAPHQASSRAALLAEMRN